MLGETYLQQFKLLADVFSFRPLKNNSSVGRFRWGRTTSVVLSSNCMYITTDNSLRTETFLSKSEILCNY